MRKRCYTCKCLEEESSYKFYQRTKDNPKTRFYCRKCDPLRKERIKKTLEKTARTREAKKEVKHFKDVCRTQRSAWRSTDQNRGPSAGISLSNRKGRAANSVQRPAPVGHRQRRGTVRIRPRERSGKQIAIKSRVGEGQI